ncbi:hypothetical protein Taro_003395 [Colocasia esculenta]|uniref:Uncharacterized protein n=1 Tax=Colocasia esculenta TaxID=4460 RepID=A0A843TGW8_COLES|nr:hypothetical protein [Colocasia esculenta]
MGDTRQDIFETMDEFVDRLKFTGGSYNLMPRFSIKELIDMAHKHDVYVSTGIKGRVISYLVFGVGHESQVGFFSITA